MKKIGKVLEPYITDLDNQLYEYSDFNKLKIDLLIKRGFDYNSLDRKLDFVDSLRHYLNHENIHDENYEVKFWIINDWGGITSFKDKVDKSNRLKIDDFLRRIQERKKLTKPLFEVISSLSKVASFSDSSNFFVYDSRVIYALNWLLLKNDIKDIKFFPMPQGRNAKLSFYDLDTIIKLSRKNDFNDLDISDFYCGYAEAYYLYCDLIKKLAKELIPERPAYHLEMFLFTLVDKIYDEIRETVDVSFSQKVI